MPLAERDALLALLAANPPPGHSIPELRNWFEQSHAALPVPDDLSLTRLSVGPAGADLIRPADADPRRLIIYYHGGGFVFGSSRSHRGLAATLAQQAGIAVLAVDYRLAPEDPFPAAHDDAYTAYLWALEAGYNAAHIGLAGDSAGGNLALSTAIRARNDGRPVPAAVALLSPALDFAGDGASHTAVVDDPILSRPLIDMFLACYLPNSDRRDPAASPLHAELFGLPPVLIHVGSWEKLRDDSLSLARRLGEAGCSTELKIWEGMFHCWQLYASMLSDGRASLAETAAFLRHHLMPA